MHKANTKDRLSRCTCSRWVSGTVTLGLVLVVVVAGLPPAGAQVVNPFIPPPSYFRVQFVTSQVGWLDRGEILHTIDGGQTWQVHRKRGNPGLGSEFPRSLQFLDPLTGWVLDDGSRVHRTTDGGQTWEVIEVRPTVQGVRVRRGTDLKQFQMVDATFGFGLSRSGDVFLRSTDGGRLWRPALIRDGMTSFEALAFIDRMQGWIAGVRGVVLTTTDGGETWKPLPSVPIKTVYSLQFLSATTGWLMETGGPRLFRTDDGARTWRVCGSGPVGTRLREAFFRTQALGWGLVAEPGVVLRTTDGCTSWQAIQTPTQQELNAVHFVDDRNGWAVGDNATVLKSTDGGLTWVAVQVNPQ